jgi:hypothetical protein
MIPRWVAAVLLVCVGGCSTFSSPRETLKTISGVPRFQTMQYGTTVEIPDREDKVSLIWPEGAPKARRFKKGRAYDFDILVKKETMSIGSRRSVIESEDLFRVRQGSNLIYDASVCRVHGTSMNRELAPILYGLPFFEDGYEKAYMKEFPNIGLHFGGCNPDPSRTKTYEWVCEKCREAEEAWEKGKGREQAR